MNLEVFDGCLPVDEEDIVLGVEDSLVDVLTGEGHDRVMVVPEADRKEFGAVTVWSADQIRILEAVRLALEAREPEAPLQPGRSDAVRVMNIHKAKGLQAPVVVLAAPVGETRRKPDHHIARLDDGRAAGYLVVQTREKWGTNIHAMPPDWFERQAAEERFDDAEEVRLMYVAATRAEDELVVARRDEHIARSPWSLLDPWLEEHGTRLDDMVIEPPRPRATLEEDGRTIRDRAVGIDVRRDKRGRPGYLFQSVTSVAKTAKKGEAQLALDLESARPEIAEVPTAAPAAAPTEDKPPEQRSRGFSWGTVVHGALAAAAGELSEEALEGVCRGLLLENERPLDAEGEPTELASLVELVEVVRTSSLWERARVAERTLVEVPFSTRVPVLAILVQLYLLLSRTFFDGS